MKILYANRPALCGVVDDWLEGQLIIQPAPEVALYYGLQKPNGKYLSVQPDSSYQERDAPNGPYEWFTIDPTVNVLIVQPKTAVYKIAFKDQ